MPQSTASFSQLGMPLGVIDTKIPTQKFQDLVITLGKKQSPFLGAQLA